MAEASRGTDGSRGADTHADVHVFGSTAGYGTVAKSRGVSSDEAHELESFQFGEASTAQRIARLETHAVMTGRALRSGRMAISRMLPAGTDDAGRPTIEVVTLLVSARDYEACVGALPLLVSDAGLWRAARVSAATEGTRIPAIAAHPMPADPQVFRLFDLWRAAVRLGAVGVVSESESEAVLRLVASLDPADRLKCRFGIGLLSLSAPVDLCSIAAGTSTLGARNAMRPAVAEAWHCGTESEYAAFRVMNGLARLPAVADVELNGRTIMVADEPSAGSRARVPAARGDAQEPVSRLLPFAIGSAVLSTVVLGVAIFAHAGRDVVSTQPPTTWSSEPSRSAASEEGSNSLEAPLPQPVTPPPTPASTPAPSEPRTEPSRAPDPPDQQPASGGETPLPDGPSTSTGPTAASDAPSSTGGTSEETGSPAKTSSVNPPEPGRQAPLTEKKFDDARTLAILLKELRDVPMPRRDPKLDRGVFNERVDAAMMRWITITFEASLLDSNLKQSASREPQWKNRDKGTWTTDGTKDVISPKSGFMMSVNRFKDLPANVEWQDEWLEFAKELQGRLREFRGLVEKDTDFSEAIEKYESVLEADGLPKRFKDLLGSDVHAAWKATTETLFKLNRLDDEIREVQRSLWEAKSMTGATP